MDNKDLIDALKALCDQWNKNAKRLNKIADDDPQDDTHVECANYAEAQESCAKELSNIISKYQ